MPTYAASKAGVHAYSEALRAQLAGTGVEVSELVPPAVATAIFQADLAAFGAQSPELALRYCSA
jgi:short-subunit dehydrogenase involved in D-alanine esterification of teichoic acids